MDYFFKLQKAAALSLFGICCRQIKLRPVSQYRWSGAPTGTGPVVANIQLPVPPTYVQSRRDANDSQHHEIRLCTRSSMQTSRCDITIHWSGHDMGYHHPLEWTRERCQTGVARLVRLVDARLVRLADGKMTSLKPSTSAV